MSKFQEWQDKFEGSSQPDETPAAESVAPQVQEPLRADIKRAYTPEQLTKQDRMDLAMMRSTAGYEVLRTVMEQQCEKAVTRHLNTDADDDRKIISSFYMAKAAWQFFVSVQKQVEYECAEAYTDEQPSIPRPFEEFTPN